jgi:hypothetical protein
MKEARMDNRATKTLLIIIVIGLWLNIVSNFINPAVAVTQQGSGYTLQGIYARLTSIENNLAEIRRGLDNVDSNVSDIQRGTCRNPKIC